MATVSPPSPPGTPPPAFPLPPFRLSVTQFDQMVAAGILAEDDPVELIEGRLVAKMPRNSPHIVGVRKTVRALERVIPEGWFVAKEDVLRIGQYSKAEPDVMVLRSDVEFDASQDPTPPDCALVVEIAESSLAGDRAEKGPVYAAAGLSVYWIVNLVDRQLEVYSDPDKGGYRARQDLAPDQQVSVVIAGNVVGRIAVADLLP
jgi:Uma2 family endonuclease